MGWTSFEKLYDPNRTALQIPKICYTSRVLKYGFGLSWSNVSSFWSKTDLFCFLSSLWSHFNPSHVSISSLEMESLLRIDLDGKIMTALYYLTEPKFRAKADLMNSK